MGPNCDISLPHAQFLSSTEHCNNWEVVGRGISVEDNCYTSQLTFQANLMLEGRTIQCAVDNVAPVDVINSTALSFTSGM